MRLALLLVAMCLRQRKCSVFYWMMTNLQRSWQPTSSSERVLLDRMAAPSGAESFAWLMTARRWLALLTWMTPVQPLTALTVTQQQQGLCRSLPQRKGRLRAD